MDQPQFRQRTYPIERDNIGPEAIAIAESVDSWMVARQVIDALAARFGRSVRTIGPGDVSEVVGRTLSLPEIDRLVDNWAWWDGKWAGSDEEIAGRIAELCRTDVSWPCQDPADNHFGDSLGPDHPPAPWEDNS